MMARTDSWRSDVSDGFEGGIAGLNLADLVQLNAQNRFSGCFRVECEGKLGLVFFRDGDILHAEVGQKAGEEAFCEIVAWPRGRFSVEPNVVAARRTINKSCEHLLLDAHRRLDERRAQHGAAPLAKPQPPQPPTPAAGPVETVRDIPGVVAAVLLTRDGKRASGGGYEAEVLAGQTGYLGMVAAELGAFFQAGELRTAAVQGSLQHLLLYANKTHYLGVGARPEEEVGSVDGAIRRALVNGR